MKIHHLLLLTILFSTSTWADFSETHDLIHPWYLEPNDPFIIELVGEWPNACHPGLQKPVITEYTGDTAIVEFETIVEQDTCAQVVTPYRVLIDMSDVVGSLEGDFSRVEVTVRFEGDEMQVVAPHPCLHLCSPVPLPRDVNPETGLYHSDNLEKQGLLLARQGQRMAAYPLIYDDSGSSEWVFAGGGITENVYFSELNELTGGQCLGCPPPAEETQLNVVGKISMLADSEGTVQIKVNDGLFVPYEQTEFGYGSQDVGGVPNRRIADLSGRWAFIDDSPLPQGEPVPEGDPLLPVVFDIRLESVVDLEPPTPIVSDPAYFPPGHAIFSIRDKAGTEYAEMLCGYPEDAYFPVDGEMVCEVSNPDVNQGDDFYDVRPSSLEQLNFRWSGPILSPAPPGYGDGTRTAVRID